MGGGEKWEGAVKWHKISFRGDENALKEVVVMVTYSENLLKSTEL